MFGSTLKNCVYTGAAFAALFLTTACGGVGGPAFVKNFTSTIDDRALDLEAEFAPELSLNFEISKPILNYGTVTFIPADANYGFRVHMNLNLEAFMDEQLGRVKTRSLPNGTAFPPFIVGELSRFAFHQGDKFGSALYLGLGATRYVGTSIELKFVDASFPAGVNFTQAILDAKKNQIGVVTLYGPKMNGSQLEAPGGIFVAASLGAAPSPAHALSLANEPVSQKGGVDADAPIIVTGPNADQYKQTAKQYRLFNQFKSRGREAGAVD